MGDEFTVGDRVRILYDLPLSEYSILLDKDVVSESFRHREGWQDLYGRKATVVEIFHDRGGDNHVVEVEPGTRIYLSPDLIEHLHPLEQLAECADE